MYAADSWPPALTAKGKAKGGEDKMLRIDSIKCRRVFRSHRLP